MWREGAALRVANAPLHTSRRAREPGPQPLPPCSPQGSSARPDSGSSSSGLGWACEAGVAPHMHTRTHARAEYTHQCTQAHMHAHVDAHTACAHMHTYTDTYHTHAHMYMHIQDVHTQHVHACTHTHLNRRIPYTCTQAHMHVQSTHTNADMCTCVHACTCTHSVHTCTPARTHITRVCTRVCTCTPTQTHATCVQYASTQCTCTRVHTHATHVCTYAHMLAHAHTRMRTHHTPHAHTLRSLTSFPGTLRPEDKPNHPREPPVTLDRVPATVPSPGGVSAPGQTHGPGGCCQRLHLFAGDPDIPGRL